MRDIAIATSINQSHKHTQTYTHTATREYNKERHTATTLNHLPYHSPPSLLCIDSPSLPACFQTKINIYINIIYHKLQMVHPSLFSPSRSRTPNNSSTSSRRANPQTRPRKHPRRVTPYLMQLSSLRRMPRSPSSKLEGEDTSIPSRLISPTSFRLSRPASARTSRRWRSRRGELLPRRPRNDPETYLIMNRGIIQFTGCRTARLAYYKYHWYRSMSFLRVCTRFKHPRLRFNWPSSATSDVW